MHSKELLKWLDEHKIAAVAKNSFTHYRNVLKTCLNTMTEPILIIGDYGYPNKRVAALMSAGYYFAAKKMGKDVRVIMQVPKIRGDSADDDVVKALMNLKSESIIVLCLSNKLGKMGSTGKSFRRFSYSKGHRFISAPGLGSINTERYISLV
ncbi:MAG: hypothetical protein KJ922_02150, partial [Nanoarchaeota archaeon]|nr:hypothetical protein [Nanoarchaeota archaeon]